MVLFMNCNQLNALIGFMQVAFAEGPSATDEEEAASAALAAENAKKAAEKRKANAEKKDKIKTCQTSCKDEGRTYPDTLRAK